MSIGDKVYICDFNDCLVYRGIITGSTENFYRITIAQEVCELIINTPKKYVFKKEEKANQMLQEGYELITMSITGTAKAILVFKK